MHLKIKKEGKEKMAEEEGKGERKRQKGKRKSTGQPALKEENPLGNCVHSWSLRKYDLSPVCCVKRGFCAGGIEVFIY